MRVLKYLKFFEEAELNLGELEKNRGGEKRGNALIKKLQEPEVKLTIKGEGERTIDHIKVDGEDVVPSIAANAIKKANTNTYDDGKGAKLFGKPRYKDVFISGDEVFKLNQVKKTKEFGAVGPGVLTKDQEAIQCLFIAYKLKYPQSSITNINYKEEILNYYEKYINKDPDTLKRVGIYLNKGVVINAKLLDSLSSNKDWLDTFIKVPEMLFRFKGKFSPRKDYSVFHESSDDKISPVQNLIKKFNELKNKKVVGSNKNGTEKTTSINFSKFCPADVYIIETSYIDILNTAISNCKTLSAGTDTSNPLTSLITLMDSYFDRNILIPVSLKKIKSGQETFQIIVNKEENKKLPDFDIKYFRITQDPTKGIGSKISTVSKWSEERTPNGEDNTIRKDRDITIDSSNTGNSVNVDGEVAGSSSRHGKISFTGIKSILDIHKDEFNLDEIEKHSELKKRTLTDLRNSITSLYNELLNLREFSNGVDVVEMPSTIQVPRLKKGIPTGTSWDKVIKYTDLSKTEEEDSNIKNKLISKLQSLQILVSIAKIYKVSPMLGNDVMTKIMRHALSIQTSDFDTPRYLRVI
jgi:hypothetical protein